MDFDPKLFWNITYFIGLFLLWLSFYFLSGPIRIIEQKENRKTHWKYLYIALAFLVIKPLLDIYFYYFGPRAVGGMVDFASIIALLMGSIFVMIPIANLSKKSLSESVGLGTWLFYMQLGVVAFFFVTQIPDMFVAISSAIYFIAALVLGISLRLMSNYAEQFEILFPLRWTFDTSAWVLPLALAIRTYGMSITTRFGDIVVASYVYGELRYIVIFLLFVCGLISFIASYTLKKAVLDEPEKS